ncbi:MAG: hypothetical protein ACYCWW_04905 [Deltaproteobacteria bacterium]
MIRSMWSIVAGLALVAATSARADQSTERQIADAQQAQVEMAEGLLRASPRSPPENPLAAQLDTKARAMTLVATASKASQAKRGAGSDPTKNGPTTAAKASAGHQNAIAAKLDPQARQTALVGKVSKANKMQKGGQGADPASTSGGGAAAPSASTGHQNAIAAQFDPSARALAVVSEASKGHAQRNAGGKTEDPTKNAPVASSGRGESHGGGSAGRIFERPASAMGAMHGMSPGDRATSCHGRGMCF